MIKFPMSSRIDLKCYRQALVSVLWKSVKFYRSRLSHILNKQRAVKYTWDFIATEEEQVSHEAVYKT